MPVEIDLLKYRTRLDETASMEFWGRVVKIVGLTVESAGPATRMGDVCNIYSQDMTSSVQAEVVGFRDDKVLLMQIGRAHV